MVKPLRLPVCLVAAGLARTAIAADVPAPTEPPSLGLRVGGSVLPVEPPDLHAIEATRDAPADHAAVWSPLAVWPGKRKDAAGVWDLAPRYDDDGSPILGGLFRQLLPETLRVARADTGVEFVADRDYRVNAEWAQVAAIDGRLGAPGVTNLRVTAKAAMQRIDLVQRAADGTVTLKRGVSRLVCPVRPDPDAGCEAVAGVYVAPWRREGGWKVLAEDILPVRAVEPVAPIRPEAVTETLAKLRAGGEVKVAFMGDSITLGAEAGKWWSDDSTTWRGRVVRGLRARFPQATVTEIQAFRGGRGIAFGCEAFEETVRPAAPDLLFVQLGINDANAPVGKGPMTPLAEFARHFDALVAKARGAGMEVVVLTTMQANPFDAGGTAARWPAYVEAQKATAERHGAGVADTHAEWMNLTFSGIPPFSQLHNWINHPNAEGHRLFAEVVLRFFPPK
jgi:lysophospholipase L1-like esterase